MSFRGVDLGRTGGSYRSGDIGRHDTKQLDEFDRCNTQEAALHWIADNRPDYKSIVHKEKEKQESEIIKYRSKIFGLLPVPVSDMNSDRFVKA